MAFVVEVSIMVKRLQALSVGSSILHLSFSWAENFQTCIAESKCDAEQMAEATGIGWMCYPLLTSQLT